MAHNHSSDTGNIKVAFFLNLSFTVIEIIGGILTNSVAIFSDAVHDLGDSLSLGMAWYFQKVSQKGRDDKYSYGYRRYSVLGALINTVVLILGCAFILWETIPRITNPQDVHPEGMVILACFGIIVNGAAVFKLKKGSSLNEKVVALHLLEDVFGWVAVLIGSIVMIFWDLPIIDPILSLAITFYILFNVYRNLKTALNVFLQRIPANVDLDKIENYLSYKKGLSNYEDIHIWSLDGNYNVMTMEISLDSNMNKNEIVEYLNVIHLELKEFNIDHCTIEIVG